MRRCIDACGSDGMLREHKFSMSLPQSPNVLTPEGALDLHVSPQVEGSLRTLIDNKPARVVVDLSRVPYIDSSGLAVLIGAMQRLESEGGVFMLAAVQEPVRQILESARLNQYFLIFPNVDAALAST